METWKRKCQSDIPGVPRRTDGFLPGREEGGAPLPAGTAWKEHGMWKSLRHRGMGSFSTWLRNGVRGAAWRQRSLEAAVSVQLVKKHGCREGLGPPESGAPWTAALLPCSLPFLSAQWTVLSVVSLSLRMLRNLLGVPQKFCQRRITRWSGFKCIIKLFVNFSCKEYGEDRGNMVLKIYIWMFQRRGGKMIFFCHHEISNKSYQRKFGKKKKKMLTHNFAILIHHYHCW